MIQMVMLRPLTHLSMRPLADVEAALSQSAGRTLLMVYPPLVKWHTGWAWAAAEGGKQ